MWTTAPCQQEFFYTNDELSSLEKYITKDRLSSYYKMADGDRKAAIKLYERNALISGALYIPLQGLEVALRNAFDSVLSADLGLPNWYDSLPLRKPQETALEKAKASLTMAKKQHEPGRIIAELPFGFWVGLTGKAYSSEGLWNRTLHKAFPNQRLQRRPCHTALNTIRLLRNRIAHHEPILSRDLPRDHAAILMVSGWISDDTRRWNKQCSPFETVHAMP